MDETFAAHGVQFRYPVGWEVSEQTRDGEWTVTVSSPHTSFWTLCLYDDRPDPESVLEAVLAAFREEYSEIDVYLAQARVCARTTLAVDIEFVCWELLNSAWARVFRTDEFTALVLYQGNDRELEETGEIMQRITRSLRCEGDVETVEQDGQ